MVKLKLSGKRDFPFQFPEMQLALRFFRKELESGQHLITTSMGQKIMSCYHGNTPSVRLKNLPGHSGIRTRDPWNTIPNALPTELHGQDSSTSDISELYYIYISLVLGTEGTRLCSEISLVEPS